MYILCKLKIVGVLNIFGLTAAWAGLGLSSPRSVVLHILIRVMQVGWLMGSILDGRDDSRNHYLRTSMILQSVFRVRCVELSVCNKLFP